MQSWYLHNLQCIMTYHIMSEFVLENQVKSSQKKEVCHNLFHYLFESDVVFLFYLFTCQKIVNIFLFILQARHYVIGLSWVLRYYYQV
jgi:5'-3' exonuclease